jgi:diguanylate cyclase (GGDEF)-like protein
VIKMLATNTILEKNDTPPLIDGLLRHAEQLFGVNVVTYTLDQHIQGSTPNRRISDPEFHPFLEGQPEIRYFAATKLRNRQRNNFGTMYLFDWKTAQHQIQPEKLQQFADLLAKALEASQLETKPAPQAYVLDPLTNLPRREQFEQQLEHWLVESFDQPKQLAVLFLDLDHFKEINDTWGHQFGDSLLKAVAQRLRDNIRPEDFLTRWGGDEFVIVMPALSDFETVQKIADRLQNVFLKPFELEHQVCVGISIGISLFPKDGQTQESLLRAADIALYHGKQQGKHQNQWYTPQLQKSTEERLELEKELLQAFAEKNFVLYYQPQIDLSSNRICGYEALLRWQHPRLGLITPTTFLPLLQTLGLAAQLDDWVIAQVLQRCAAWRKTESSLQLSVNISAQRFASRDLVTYIENLLVQYGLPSNVLWLELSETALQKHQCDPQIIETLAKLGVGVALDDFGIGASNLEQLQKMGLKRLKIHRQFIQELEQNQTLIKTMLYIAAQFGIEVIAQGVESENQLTWLREHNCQMVQGFLLSEPMVAEAFTKPNRAIVLS